MNRKLILILVLAIAAAVAFFCLRSPAGIPMEPVSAETARETADFARKAFEAYRNAPGLAEKQAGFADGDSDMIAQMTKHLDQLKSPDFSKACVKIVKGNPDTFCVDVPDDGKTVRFVVKRNRGRLGLAACGGAW